MKRMNRLLIFVFVLAAACGRDELPTSPAPAPIASDTAEVRVVASSGPVQIELILPQTRIARDRGIWFQLEIANLGDEPLPLDDSFQDSIRAVHQWRTSTYIEVLDSSGKRVIPPTPFHGYPDPNGAMPPERKLYPELGEMIRRWEAAGITGSDLDLKIIEYTNPPLTRAQRSAQEAHERARTIHLKPGERRRLPPWAAAANSTRQRNGAPERSDFVELPDLGMQTGRKYKMRAVYDRAVSPRAAAIYGRHREPVPGYFVTVRTPFIEFELLP